VIHNKFPHNTCADQLCWPFRTWKKGFACGN
jgi:hypothetical protein